MISPSSVLVASQHQRRHRIAEDRPVRLGVEGSHLADGQCSVPGSSTNKAEGTWKYLGKSWKNLGKS